MHSYLSSIVCGFRIVRIANIGKSNENKRATSFAIEYSAYGVS